MPVVLSVGGSLINTENGIDRTFLAEIKKIIEKSGQRFGIVTGGGRAARAYANAVRKKGGNEFEADEAAIKATKENAKVLIRVLGKIAYTKVCESFAETRTHAKKYRVVVMGGTIPGITTDADAVLLAEALHATRVVNISNVEAVYDSDPKKNPTAKRYTTLTHAQLIDLAVRSDTRTAGTHFVFDLLACKLAARSKLKLHFVSGKKLHDVDAAIRGAVHHGTVVK